MIDKLGSYGPATELEEQDWLAFMAVWEIRWDKGSSDLAQDCVCFCGNGNDSCMNELQLTAWTV